MASRDLVIDERLTVPGAELDLQFSRASGAGGQNVNKVNSRVELRYALEASTALPADVKARLRAIAGRSRLTGEGELLVTCQRHRDQSRNIEECYDKLRAMIEAALIEPEERRPTRPTRASKERRLQAKKATSRRKSERGRPQD